MLSPFYLTVQDSRQRPGQMYHSVKRRNQPDFVAASLPEVTWQVNKLFTSLHGVVVQNFRPETYALLIESYYGSKRYDNNRSGFVLQRGERQYLKVFCRLDSPEADSAVAGY